jgi:hypothetical protein
LKEYVLLPFKSNFDLFIFQFCSPYPRRRPFRLELELAAPELEHEVARGGAAMGETASMLYGSRPTSFSSSRRIGSLLVGV